MVRIVAIDATGWVYFTAHAETRIYDTHLYRDRALQAIDEGLDAKQVQVHEGTVVDCGPDHYARLTAVARFLKVPNAGRPIATMANPRSITLITRICGAEARAGPASAGATSVVKPLWNRASGADLPSSGIGDPSLPRITRTMRG